MLSLRYRDKSIKTIFLYILVVIVIGLSIGGCSDRLRSQEMGDSASLANQPHRLSEVASPEIIDQLSSILSIYQPQVTIIKPEANQIFTDTTVNVELDVKDLPIFRDEQLEMGPYLQLIVDNDRYIPIYDLNQEIAIEDLDPGTHTLRVFAVKPWHESFKNEGAYTQTQFHIFTPTDKQPDSSLPLLTYNSPQGDYGEEPIMLDFYLTNVPLHLVARENQEDEINDWRIRVTINDESFLLDSWKPVYLTGFQPGINWVKLEFIDELGNRIENLYNTTVKLFNYKDGGEDTLSKLVRGELTLEQARSITDPNYTTTQIPELPSTEVEPEELETTPELPSTQVEPEELETTPELPSTQVEPEELETTPELPSTQVEPEELETTSELPSTQVEPEELETTSELPSTEVEPEELETTPELPSTEVEPEELETTPELPTTKTQPPPVKTLPEILE